MSFDTVSAKEIDRYLFQTAYMVIDIRTREAYEEKHIEGAVWIPYEQLEEKIRGLKGKELILYCDRGGKSLKAARELGEKGYHVKTVIGGILAYRGTHMVYGRR